jgi:hypothetical protein
LTFERVARETLAHALLPRAFKRAGDQAGPDEQTELLSVWWNARCSLLKSRQHLLSEAEALLRGLPLELIERLPDGGAPQAWGARHSDPPSTVRSADRAAAQAAGRVPRPDRQARLRGQDDHARAGHAGERECQHA